MKTKFANVGIRLEVGLLDQCHDVMVLHDMKPGLFWNSVVRFGLKQWMAESAEVAAAYEASTTVAEVAPAVYRYCNRCMDQFRIADRGDSDLCANCDGGAQ